MTQRNRKSVASRGPASVGSIVKRYRKLDRQYTYGLRVRAYGERYWIPFGPEREGWNDVRAADRRDEIAALISRGAWRPPNTFELDPREKNPGFHEFASDWLRRYRRTVDETTADKVEYLLSHHLLPFLHTYRLDEIDYAVLSAYVAHKLERNEEIETAREAGVTLRDSSGRRRRPLSPRTINMSLDLAARIFTDAVKRGLLPNNPARDRDLRLKVTQRKGNFLEADELLALIEAASAIDDPVSPHTLGRAELVRRMRGDNRTWKEIAAELDVAETTAIWLAGRYRREGRASPRRAIVATLGCAGLRNTEVCDLNVGDLDLAHGVIHVRDAKTEAGIRQVHMTPWLHDELLAYRATGPTRSRTSPRSRRAAARAETSATSTGG
jgi:integrase